MKICYIDFNGIIKQKCNGEWFVENIHPYKYSSVSSKDISEAIEYWKQEINYIIYKNKDNYENR